MSNVSGGKRVERKFNTRSGVQVWAPSIRSVSDYPLKTSVLAIVLLDYYDISCDNLI